ncbi:hypothetical protein HN748_06480 [Candidatus Peregrinibacteria bacterium]|jgi:hypothetical protein|nr:hypothetical protein [Candidatus Peregrinibacteria bacterium]MBT7484523.1 hypothetical protein [Candidatus Peregrinibacteria bacterium]MBT7703849.1 hypothetical protein [Candidatus Peregrinibacteria bacterium]
MKFRTLIPYAALLLVFGLLFTGCQLPFTDDVTVEDDISYEFMTYEGLLQSLGSVKFNPDATHLLRLTDGSLLYVYSDFYNLWDTEYLNQSMEVSGLLIPGEDDDDKPVLAVEQLTVLEEEEVVEIEEVEMTNYVSESIGFGISYRSDWEMEERTQAVSFYGPQPKDTESLIETDLIQVSTLSNNEELEIEEWYLAYQNTDLSETYTKNVVSVDQLNAIKVEEVGSTTYYVEGGSKVFVLLHLNSQEDLKLSYGNLFSEMLLSFDLLSDGQRIEEDEEEEEVVEETEITEVIEDVEDVVAEEEANESSDGDYADNISLLENDLDRLSLVSDEWTATTYDFVEPNYIYVTFTDGEVLERYLLQNLGDGNLEELAKFVEGAITDWDLASGTDEAKGLEQVSVDAETGSETVILEGYRPLESATLGFQMQYPSNWYYSRSGSSFYFSNEPADASNALVTLEVIEETVSSLKTWSSSGFFFADVPRDDSSSYRLKGTLDYQEQIEVMAESILST